MGAVLVQGNTYLETGPMSNSHVVSHRLGVPKLEEES